MSALGWIFVAASLWTAAAIVAGLLLGWTIDHGKRRR